MCEQPRLEHADSISSIDIADEEKLSQQFMNISNWLIMENVFYRQ